MVIRSPHCCRHTESRTPASTRWASSPTPRFSRCTTNLSKTIATAPADVVIVLERLLAGSQNHLAAFERQV